MTDVTREDVIRKIHLANSDLDNSNDEQMFSFEEQRLLAMQALAQAQIATAYATLLAAEKPLFLLAEIVRAIEQLKQES